MRAKALALDRDVRSKDTEDGSRPTDDEVKLEDTNKMKGPLAAVTDDSCTVEFIEIVPLDKASDDYNTQDFIPTSFEVKLDVKQEAADESDNEDANYPIKQELADDYETEHPCFTIQVSSLMLADFSHRNLVVLSSVYVFCNKRITHYFLS